MKCKRRGVIVLLLALWATPAMAMNMSQLEAAKERAGMLDQVRTLLADDSASVRLAVFEEVMKSDDPVLRSMALESAFSSGDERLQTAGLRQLFQDRELLSVEVIEPREPSQAQAYTFQLWRELMLKELRIDQATDELSGSFNGARASGKFVGHLTRGGWRVDLSWAGYSCSLELTQVSGVDLSGALRCAITGRHAREGNAGGQSATLPFRIRLS
ncbi:hypothetical protein FEI13_16330 [Halomonas urmiana]|uniref:HEAT repeat domain-containing protein n=1 Tax=Halomonas urmiana TaxID=490901 RepID=A0A5R8MCE6_9GAMM|nr:hypothetical protein [Halomonas urmiana]TLF47242.1 hypothetical protein FEI13_16330 [Halomonas urmiana]